MSLPGLTVNLINKNLPKSLATEKFHLDQEFKNLQSTKIDAAQINEDLQPPQEPENIRTQYIICAIFDYKELASKIYFNQTRCFPIKSSKGNQYIFILYHYYTNIIHIVHIKSRHTEHIPQIWKDTFQILKKWGTPKHSYPR